MEPRAQWTDGDLPHVHVGQVQQRAALPDRDHRHRAVAAASDDAATLEWVERQIDGIAAGADLAADVQGRFLVRGADHDPSGDRKVVEHRPHRRGRIPLGGLLVSPAEPACGRERSPLGHAHVLLAQAERRRRCFYLIRRDRLVEGFWHQTLCTCSALASTSSRTASIAPRMSLLTITGTLWRFARPTMWS